MGAADELDEQAREILEQHAEQLRTAPKSGDDQLAVFAIGDETFAIVLSAFRAVLQVKRVTRVPLARPHILGVLRFQGQIITALSTATLLGIDPMPEAPTVLVVVDSGWGRLVAIDCAEVPRPVSVARAVLGEARSNETRPTSAIVHEGRVVHVLELPRLLDRRSGARGGR